MKIEPSKIIFYDNRLASKPCLMLHKIKKFLLYLQLKLQQQD